VAIAADGNTRNTSGGEMKTRRLCQTGELSSCMTIAMPGQLLTGFGLSRDRPVVEAGVEALVVPSAATSSTFPEVYLVVI